MIKRTNESEPNGPQQRGQGLIKGEVKMVWEKKVAQIEAVKSFLVTVDGKVNLEASVEKFRNVALRTLASQEAEDTMVVTCMNALFDQFPGANLNLDFIKSNTVQMITKQNPDLKDPSLHSILSTRVEEVLHALSDRPASPAKGELGTPGYKPAVEAITNRAFGVKIGKGGGWFRKSDRAQKPA